MGEEIFIDANIFLEIFLKDKKAEECKSFLRSLQEQERNGVTTDFIIYSCILQVQNKLKNAEFIANTIIFFNSHPNLKILRPSFEDLHNSVETMEMTKLDFDDSLVVSCMKSYGIKELASLDKHFDKVKWIKRVKP